MSSKKRNCPRIELKYTSTTKGNWNNLGYHGEQNRESRKLWKEIARQNKWCQE